MTIQWCITNAKKQSSEKRKAVFQEASTGFSQSYLHMEVTDYINGIYSRVNGR